MARSPLTAPESQLLMETQIADLARLIDTLADEPGVLPRVQFGALIGLDTDARRRDHIALLVAHEPPAPYVLPPPARRRGGSASG